MAKSLQKAHWLVHVLGRAGIRGAEQLAMDPAMPPAEAWTVACQRLGITQDDLALHVADYFRLRVARLENAEPTALKLIPEKVARQYAIVPVKEDDRHLTVATADPTDFAAEQALGFISGRKTIFEVAPPPIILDYLNASYSPDGVAETLRARGDAARADSVSIIGDEDTAEPATEGDPESAPVVRLTRLLFRDAVQSGASDVHIETGASGGTVRFRVDGVLRSYMQLPLPTLTRLVSRIKSLGSIETGGELRRDRGRARVLVDGQRYDVRISTAPARGAEKVVLRILREGQAARLSEIGLPSWELGRLRQLLSREDGIVCVAGPSGSGRTTTLYAGIRELAAAGADVVAVEDPPEYELPGVRQIAVQAERGVTFASALRSVVEDEPDVVLVGTLADAETAQAALKAAMAGTLVLTTLPAEDAVGVVAHLRGLGLDDPAIAAALRGAIAQRLVRKVCDECGEPIRGRMTPEEARLAKLYNFRPPLRSVGCRRCAETGYRGRVPVQEVFLINRDIADMIGAGASRPALYTAAAAAGMRPLLQVGLDRVRSGETTLEELERVLGPGEDRPRVGEPTRPGSKRAAGPPESEEDAGLLDLERFAPSDGGGGGPVEPHEPSLEGIGAGLEYAGPDPDEQAPAAPREPEAPMGDLGLVLDRRELGESLVPDGPAVPLHPAERADGEAAGAAGPGTGAGGASGEVEEPAGARVGGGTELAPAVEGGAILVVDGDPEDRLEVCTILSEHGFDVEEARDGEEALRRIGQAGAPPVVVLDRDLPDMDARQVLARLRSEAAAPGIQVIVIAGSSGAEDEADVVEAGADDYLEKPLEAERFVTRVRAAVRRAGGV